MHHPCQRGKADHADIYCLSPRLVHVQSSLVAFRRCGFNRFRNDVGSSMAPSDRWCHRRGAPYNWSRRFNFQEHLISTMSALHIPHILLAIPRNPVTAVGLPLVAGFLSGSPTSTKVANSNWYYVRHPFFVSSVRYWQWGKNLEAPPGQPPKEVFPFVWTLLYCCECFSRVHSMAILISAC